MANELSLINNNLPAHLRGELDETTRSLMGNGAGGAPSNSKRISIKGAVFRMVVDGKEVAQNEERSMNVIIVAAAPHNARTYYASTFTEDQVVKAPSCFSDDGITPSTRSIEKQANSCKDCPQNVDGSHPSGKGRACRYSRRLAVLLENDQKGDVFQLTLPASSIFGKGENGKLPLEAYGRLLGSNGVPITGVVTEMRFDTNATAPKLTFKAVRYLEADEMTNARDKGKTPEAKKAIGSTPAELDGAKLPAPVVEAKPAPAVEAAPAPEPTKRAKKTEEAPKDINSVLDDWA